MKLTLSRETLRNIGQKGPGQVAGGALLSADLENDCFIWRSWMNGCPPLTLGVISCETATPTCGPDCSVVR